MLQKNINLFHPFWCNLRRKKNLWNHRKQTIKWKTWTVSMKKKVKIAQKRYELLLTKQFFLYECVSVNVCQILKKKEDEEIKKRTWILIIVIYIIEKWTKVEIILVSKIQNKNPTYYYIRTTYTNYVCVYIYTVKTITFLVKIFYSIILLLCLKTNQMIALVPWKIRKKLQLKSSLFALFFSIFSSTICWSFLIVQ